MTEHPEPHATAREDLCRFLAACFYEPDAMLEEERVFDSMHRAAGLLGPDLAAGVRRLGEAFAAVGLQELLVDYTRLFMGPPAPLAKPYGSVWLSGEARVMDESTLALEALYREAGFEVAEELHEPSDHIAVELEFLYLLTFECNESRSAGSEEAAAAWEQLRQSFLREHVGAWAFPFTDAVRANAGTPFYRQLAEVTARFLRMERERLPSH